MSAHEKIVELILQKIPTFFAAFANNPNAMQFAVMGQVKPANAALFQGIGPEEEKQLFNQALERFQKKGTASGGGGNPLPKNIMELRQQAPRQRTRPGDKSRDLPHNLRLSAPFRFVDLSNDIVYPDRQIHLDQPLAGGLCATLSVDWVAETPILIGKEDPETKQIRTMKLPGPDGGQPFLPGTTLRGLVRNSLETVAGARLGYVNRNRRAGLRDFDHAAYKNPILVSEVQAGWLYKAKRKDGSLCYAIESIGHYWAHVEIDKMLKHHGIGLQPKSWSLKKVMEKYALLGMAGNGSIDFKKTFSFTDVEKFKGHEKDFRLVCEPDGPFKGTYVFSGALPGKNGKRMEYVFYDVARQRPLVVKDSVWDTFDEIHSKVVDTRREPEGSWEIFKPLVEKGVKIPVFYVGDLSTQGPDFRFGFTRLFKVPHKRSIGEVLLESHKAHQPLAVPSKAREGDGVYRQDFVENLFGHVTEKDDIANSGEFEDLAGLQRKGRVAFGNAMLTETDTFEELPAIEALQLGPKPTFAPFYLKSATEKDYSADDTPSLAGRKFFPPRQTGNDAMAARTAKIRSLAAMQIQNANTSTDKEEQLDLSKVASHLRFLVPRAGCELRFRGEIRLNNVSAAELGALLFVLTHGGNPKRENRFMIGRGKPYGAGQTRVDRLRLRLEPNDVHAESLIKPPSAEEIFNGQTGFCSEPAADARDNATLAPFLEAFCSTMQKQKGHESFPNTTAVSEWLGVSDPALGAAEEDRQRLDYLPVAEFRTIQKQTKPWPDYQRPKRLVEKGERDGRYLAAPVKKFWK